MLRNRAVLFVALAAWLAACVPTAAESAAYKYIRVGAAADAATTARPGLALMGGGTDQDEAFRFLCDRAGGGDFLILRSHGGDDYNPYVQKLCKVNSVATLIVPSRAAAEDPFVARAIAQAEAVFIAGGDQGEYVNFWKGTPVEAELNRAIGRGVPVGGTSAGLAVLGEFVYTSLGDKPDDPNLDAKTALGDPFGPRITLDRAFVDIALLKNTITDTHFAKRNRMGRLLVFLARIRMENDVPARAIAVDEKSAVLVEPTGAARVIGPGRGAWFVDAAAAKGTLEARTPLSFGPFAVQHVAAGHGFDLRSWSGEANAYTLNVVDGEITSPAKTVY